MANKIVFEASAPDAQLHQGEIISGLVEYVFDPETEGVEAIEHGYCVVATQECDLTRDYESRAGAGQNFLKSILLLVANEEEEARAAGINHGAWQKVKQNSLERWHALEPATPEQVLGGVGLPVLVMDFREYFCVPASEVYRQILAGTALRRSILLSPYREHLQSRLAAYLARVALDREHEI